MLQKVFGRDVPTRFCDEWLCRHQRKEIPFVLADSPVFSGQLTICGTFICLADKGVLVSVALVFDL